MGSTLRTRTAASTRLWWATPEVGLPLVVTAATGLWTVVRSGNLHAMPDAMGLTLPAFLLMWAPMVTSMMLPAVAPVASLSGRSVERQRRADLERGAEEATCLIRYTSEGVWRAMKSSIRRQASAEASACCWKVRSKNEWGAPW